LVYRRPNRFRYEESASQESIIVACDGKQLWIYSASRRQYTIQAAPDNMEEAHDVMGVYGRSFLNAFAFLQGANPLNEVRTVRFIGTGKLRGVPVDIVELRGGPSDIGLSDSVTHLYIGTKDGLLYKSETVQSRYGYPDRPNSGEPPVRMHRSII